MSDPTPAPSTPSITAAQVLAALVGIVGALTDATLIDGRLSKLLTGIAAIVIPFGWILADALIRTARSKSHAAITVARIHSDLPPPPPNS